MVEIIESNKKVLQSLNMPSYSSIFGKLDGRMFTLFRKCIQKEIVTVILLFTKNM